MPPPAKLVALVERFRRNRDDYTGDRYNETQVRRGGRNELSRVSALVTARPAEVCCQHISAGDRVDILEEVGA